MIKNKKFSNAINNIPQSTPPIWFMRQAGRYHSHYQSLRKKHSFVDLCKTPSLAAEVAMGPINDFDYDVDYIKYYTKTNLPVSIDLFAMIDKLYLI